jgi:hypothetical protein
MSTERIRMVAAMSGIAGAALLIVYFAAAPPLPPANATVAEVVATGSAHHTVWLLGSWVQALGSVLSVVFFVLLVQLAGASSRLSGIFTFIGCAVLLAVVSVEGALQIDLAQSAVNGHGPTAVTDYDLVTVFIHVFPMVASPLILLSVGAAVADGRLVPRVFGYVAIGLGTAYLVVGVAGLFTAPALTLVVLGVQSLWVIALAVRLLVGARRVPTPPSLSAEGLGVARSAQMSQ